MPSHQNVDTIQDEIFLVGVVIFLQIAWKKLAISTAVGAALGFTGWFVMAGYSAEYILLNNNSYALDLVSWKMLQKSLPNLADQIIAKNKVPDNQLAIYKAMANYQWTHRNIIPNYALSKADTKDLANISKDLDSASTTILNFTLTTTGSSKEVAIESVRAASKFLSSVGAYLQPRSLLSGYETQIMSEAADLQEKINRTQIEIGYEEDPIRRLEDLSKKFSDTRAVISHTVIDGKDFASKFLPLQTQIIAAINDVNCSKETLARLQKRLDQMEIVKIFVGQSLPLQEQTFGGLFLIKQFLEIESSLRAKLAKDNSNNEEFLNGLKRQLASIQAHFTKGLEANMPPTSNPKKGMLKWVAGGLVASFFMLLFLLAQRYGRACKDKMLSDPMKAIPKMGISSILAQVKADARDRVFAGLICNNSLKTY